MIDGKGSAESMIDGKGPAESMIDEKQGGAQAPMAW
jgi:hypothetical protein